MNRHWKGFRDKKNHTIMNILFPYKIKIKNDKYPYKKKKLSRDKQTLIWQEVLSYTKATSKLKCIKQINWDDIRTQ